MLLVIIVHQLFNAKFLSDTIAIIAKVPFNHTRPKEFLGVDVVLRSKLNSANSPK